MYEIYPNHMRKLILLFILFASPLLIHAQEWLWSNQLKCAGAVVPLDVITDNSGNVYVTGTYKTATLYIGADTVHNKGGDDCFIAKFDASGSLQWLKRISGSSDEESVALVIAGSYLYVAGSFKSSTLYFTGTSTLSNENNFDSFIGRYDLNGNFQSAVKIFGGTDVQRIKDLLYHPTLNHFMILAQFKNQIKYTDQSGAVTVPAKSTKDLFIAKANTSFVIQDTVRYTTNPQNSILKDINRSYDDGYYLSGDLFGTVNFGGGNSITGHLPTTTADVLIVKINQNLDFQWARKGGSTGYDHGNNAIADIYSNIYVTGKVEGAVNFDSTDILPSHTIPNIGAQDLYLAKYNKLGTLQWIKRKGDLGNDDGFGMAQRENLVQFCGNISGQVVFNTDTLKSSGLSDINTGFAVFNTSGDEIGAQGIGGTGLDLGNAITFDPNGRTIITGPFSSPTMDIGDSSYTNASGVSNGFIASFDYPLNAVFTTVDPIGCNGDTDGRLIVTPYFGVGPYQYNWSGNVLNSQDSLAFNLGAGDYTVTVIDALNDTAISSYIFSQPQVLSLGAVKTDVNCHPENGIGNNGTINLTVTGGTVSSGYNYYWDAISGSGVSATSEDQTTLTEGNYRVIVTDDNLCQASDTIAISQPDLITFGLSVVTNETIPPGANGAINLSVQGGNPAYSYSWSGPGGFTAVNDDITNLHGGNYTIQILDTKSCAGDTTFLVTNDTMLIAYISDKTDVDCKGNSTGSATVSVENGTGPYSYEWRNNLGAIVGGDMPTLVDVPADIYFVTLTDNSSSKEASTMVQISEPLLELTTSIIGTDIECYGELTGVADLTVEGGNLPYVFSWSNGTSLEDLLNVAADNYTVTVTDSKGCSATDQITIDEPEAMDITFSVDQPILCNGDLNGIVTATATGGTGIKEYLWDDPGNQSLPTATDLGGGTYHVTATDILGCVITGQILLIEPDLLTLSETHQDITCYRIEDGIINLSVSGGTPVYSYDWSNGAISQDISALDTGAYSVVVTDAHTCTANLSTALLEPEELVIVSVDVDENDITVTVTGGTPPYTYTLDGTIENSTGIFMDVPGGTHSISVTDDNSCGPETVNGIIIPVGINDYSGGLFNIYPNPSVGMFMLEMIEVTQADYRIQIFSANGAMIFEEVMNSGNLTEKKFEIDLSSQPAGVYLLKINGITIDTKLIIR
jgi:hypothetical protein